MPSDRDLANFSTDPGRLLPEEDPSSNEPEDAQHWVAVYSELLKTKRQLVGNLREMMERQEQAVQDELERADVRLLELQIHRFEYRLSLWQAKLASRRDARKVDA
jgi:hypothetical protein